MKTDSVDIAIVGAGPYGLSLAAHLRGSNTSFRIFGKPMETWQSNMPAGMMLKSEGDASDLYDPARSFTLAEYSRRNALPYKDHGLPVRLETFVSYGREFQRRFVPDLEQTKIASIARRNQSFILQTTDGERFLARFVVIATGTTGFDYLPPLLSGHDPDFVSHSSAYGDASRLSGKRVAVIGGGSSALDLAVALREQGCDVSLLARRERIAFHQPPVERRPLLSRIKQPRSGLGLGWRSVLCTEAPLVFHALPEAWRIRIVQRHLGPAPGWFVRDRISGLIPMHLGASLHSLKITCGSVDLNWNDSRGLSHTLRVDHVIGATGYRPDVSRLSFLAPDLVRSIRTAGTAPALDRNFQSSVDGLYFVGLASANSFGPVTRFAYGAGFSSRRLSSQLLSKLRRPLPQALRAVEDLA